MTPLQFQKHLRLQEARSLILAEERPVTGIAHAVGYASPSQFSREYRRLFGVSPSQDAARLRPGASSAS
ncbi:MAG: helix-turn-helix transcriptional regulator [Galbitalea sp.]